ncbi:SUR7/PalI family-domain-containing protein [Thermothelomyces heterothallicus CBS 202.75]|uniref:SUR7/PalI family-domain-containing protein n=1 Tax=Thermothelomyces heterothallicus CBS 202.75 TaxID=1149848 RepID=UPI00374281DE
MASFGRFVCVLVPFLLTLASLIALLVAGLAGIADKSLYMFRLNLTDLSLSPQSVSSILDGSGVNVPDLKDLDLPNFQSGKRQASSSGNLTAADLGLYDVYDVNVWNYCYTMHNGTRDCTKGSFDWASTALNSSTNDFNNMLTATGLNVTLPKEITGAVKTFSKVSKWTQIVFIIAYVALALELFFGLFANCSRAFSCVTWLIAAVATVAAGAAAGLATATATVVVGAVKASPDLYGLEAHLNTRFLAAIWLGVALALAAGLFWMFTICCCKPDHSSSRGYGASEKFIPRSPGYQRLGEPGGYPSNYARPYGGASSQRADAYEPYSHARV